MHAHGLYPDLIDLIEEKIGDRLTDLEKQLSKMELQITNDGFQIKRMPAKVRKIMGFKNDTFLLPLIKKKSLT